MTNLAHNMPRLMRTGVGITVDILDRNDSGTPLGDAYAQVTALLDPREVELSTQTVVSLLLASSDLAPLKFLTQMRTTTIRTIAAGAQSVEDLDALGAAIVKVESTYTHGRANFDAIRAMTPTAEMAYGMTLLAVTAAKALARSSGTTPQDFLQTLELATSEFAGTEG